MTITLDGIMRLGDLRIAAVVERSFGARAGDDGIGLHARKTPLAILARHGKLTTMVRIADRPIDDNYSTQRREFEQAVAGATPRR